MTPTKPDVIIARDGTMTGDPQLIEELVDLAKSKREAARAAMLAFNLGVKSERERCAKIADGMLLEMSPHSWRHCACVASIIAARIRKDRGCDPPQGPPA